MIKLILPHENTDKDTAVVLGNFDGVHLGHQYLIKEAIKISKEQNYTPALCTFDPHPVAFYTDDIKLISTQSDKQKIVEELGIKIYALINFDKMFANLTPQLFLDRYIMGALNAKAIIVGEDFRFGVKRSGDSDFLQEYSKNNKIFCKVLPKLYINNEEVSSTIIRNLIVSNQMEKIYEFLGRDFSFTSTVTHGNKLGRNMGFPTLNFALTDSRLLPPDGVYAGYTFINNLKYAAMVYIGNRPTVVENGVKRLEAHIIDYKGQDLYDQEIEVFIASFIRAGNKYQNLEKLKEQLIQDKLKIIDRLHILETNKKA